MTHDACIARAASRCTDQHSVLVQATTCARSDRFLLLLKSEAHTSMPCLRAQAMVMKCCICQEKSTANKYAASAEYSPRDPRAAVQPITCRPLATVTFNRCQPVRCARVHGVGTVD